MATVYDMGGDTLVVADIVTGVTSPGQAQVGAANIVGMDIGGVVFGQMTANSTAFVGTTSTTFTAIFGSGAGNISTNGAATLSANQTYMFEGMVTLTATTTLAHNYAFAFGGNATIASMAYNLYATINTSSGTAVANTVNVYVATAGTSPAIVVASGTVDTTTIFMNGMVTVGSGGGGTIIPQFKFSTAIPASVVTIYKGSYIGFWPVGNATTQTVGSWS